MRLALLLTVAVSAATCAPGRSEDASWTFETRLAKVEKKLETLEKQVKALRDANYLEKNPKKVAGDGVAECYCQPGAGHNCGEYACPANGGAGPCRCNTPVAAPAVQGRWSPPAFNQAPVVQQPIQYVQQQPVTYYTAPTAAYSTSSSQCYRNADGSWTCPTSVQATIQRQGLFFRR